MIISISGKKRHGKDSVAAMLHELCQVHGKSYKPYRFASMLDEIHKEITGVDYSKLSGDEKEEARPYIIGLARKLEELYGPDVFVNKQLYNMDIMESATGAYTKNVHVFTDTRLKRELEPLKEKNAITVKVVRFQPGDEILYDNGTTIVKDTIVKCGEIAALLKSGVTAGYIEIQHPSIGHFTETELDYEKFDHVIYNVGDIDDLRGKVVELFNPIILKYN